MLEVNTSKDTPASERVVRRDYTLESSGIGLGEEPLGTRVYRIRNEHEPDDRGKTTNYILQQVFSERNKRRTAEELQAMSPRQRILEMKLRGELPGEKGKQAWIQLAREESEKMQRALGTHDAYHTAR